MFSIKMNARYIVHGGNACLKKACLEQGITAFGFAVCLCAVTGIFLCGENYLFRYFPFSVPVMTAVIVLAGLFFLFLFSASRLYFISLVFYLSDEAFSSPKCLMKASAVLRFSACFFLVRVVKLMWKLLFFSPSALLFVLVFRTLSVRGAMSEVMLYTLLASAALLFAAGLAFYLFVCSRFLLWELLFVRNPRQSIREIIKTSVCLSQAHRAGFLFFFIRKHFYFTLLGKTVCALRLQELFGEKKYYSALIPGQQLYQSIPRAF